MCIYIKESKIILASVSFQHYSNSRMSGWVFPEYREVLLRICRSNEMTVQDKAPDTDYCVLWVLLHTLVKNSNFLTVINLEI